MELRDFGPFPKLRDKGQKSVGELQQGKDRSATKLCKEIATLSMSYETSGAEQTCFILNTHLDLNGLNLDLKIPVEMFKKWARIDNSCVRDLTSISEESSKVTSGEFLESSPERSSGGHSTRHGVNSEKNRATSPRVSFLRGTPRPDLSAPCT